MMNEFQNLQKVRIVALVPLRVERCVMVVIQIFVNCIYVALQLIKCRHSQDEEHLL